MDAEFAEKVIRPQHDYRFDPKKISKYLQRRLWRLG
jgi:hypothetical protein